MKKDNVIQDKSFLFAVRIVNLSNTLFQNNGLVRAL